MNFAKFLRTPLFKEHLGGGYWGTNFEENLCVVVSGIFYRVGKTILPKTIKKLSVIDSQTSNEEGSLC